MTAAFGGGVRNALRVPLLAGDRRDVDDAPVVPLHHVRRRRPREVEGPHEVVAEGDVERVCRQLPYVAVVIDAAAARVVDEDVDAAPSVHGRLDRSLCSRGVANVPDREPGVDARLSETRYRCVSPLLVKIDDGDRGSFAAEPSGRREPYLPTGARDYRRLAVESTHGSSPMQVW